MNASFEETVTIAEKEGLSFAEAVLEQQSRATAVPVEVIRKETASRLDEMEHSVLDALKRRCEGKISRADSSLLETWGKGCEPFAGRLTLRAAEIAMATAASNACMGRIVAAPTAGSCGIIPGILLAAGECRGYGRKTLLEGLITAGGIGQVIASRATLAGAEGGCQAECGAAAAMAAGALITMDGHGAQRVTHAAALVLKSILGLVCDPVAGLVEVPCIKRNGVLTGLATICADMAAAGVRSVIPPDEVVDALFKVGKALPETLRETGLGGLAATPTGKKLAEDLRESAPKLDERS
ncbi:MAG: L-serine ammonia-lyase, iron-sulfur-dependent, subunit alpha [Thermovirgaceae bacterium]